MNKEQKDMLIELVKTYGDRCSTAQECFCIGHDYSGNENLERAKMSLHSIVNYVEELLTDSKQNEYLDKIEKLIGVNQDLLNLLNTPSGNHKNDS